jgi:hypothetical protein
MRNDENGVTQILFVRGFATELTLGTSGKPIGVDEYLYLKLFIETIHHDLNPNNAPCVKYKVDYFNYGPKRDINKVYADLRQQANAYDILIGHSLGGGLLAKYREEDGVNKKIILLMPLMFRNDSFDLLNKFVFDPQIALNVDLMFPKALFLPAQYIFEGGNLLNSDFSLISFKQPYDFYKEFDDDSKKAYLQLFECNGNLTMFYANGELLNTIDEDTLTQIETTGNLIRVEGLHECWRSINVNTNDFFTKLEKVLAKPIIPLPDPYLAQGTRP